MIGDFVEWVFNILGAESPGTVCRTQWTVTSKPTETHPYILLVLSSHPLLLRRPQRPCVHSCVSMCAHPVSLQISADCEIATPRCRCIECRDRLPRERVIPWGSPQNPAGSSRATLQVKCVSFPRVHLKVYVRVLIMSSVLSALAIQSM